MSDLVYVIDVDGYYGTDTAMEIGYAMGIGKKVVLYSTNGQLFKEVKNEKN